MHKKWIILAITTIASFMTPLDGSITNVAIPIIAESFQATFNLIALVPLAYLLSLSLFMIPFGKLADIYGRKKFFIAGLFIFTLASFFSGISTSIYHLLISRFIQGIGASLLASTVIAIVTESFPQNERGKALGINVASVYIGLTLGPLIGGFIIQLLNWRYIFFINLPIGIICFIGALIYINDIKEIKQKSKFNFLGSITLIIFLATIFSISLISKTYLLAIIFLSLIFFILFIITEITSRYPLIGLKILIKNRLFVAANATALFNYLGIFSISFLMSFFFIDILGFSPLKTGLILATTPVTMAILSPIAGHLSDKIGSRFLSSLGMACITAGLIILSFITINIPLYLIIFDFILIGIGMGFFSSPNTSSVMGSVEKYQLGTASSFLGTIRFIGQTLSITIITIVISLLTSSELMKGLILGTARIIEAKIEFITGMHYVFLLFAVITFLGIFTSLARGKNK